MKKCSACKGSGEIHQTQRTFFGSFSRVTTCVECQGEGELPEKTCTKCRGRGVITDIETITVNIPFGVDDGQIIKLEGQGEAGKKGELPGDLYIRIHLKKHKDFIKKGDDIYYELSISFTQAALGDKIEISTLEGRVKLKIPAGIESGKLIRIKSKGMPKASGGKGDQFIKIQIKTPKKLSQKAKDLLKKLKDEGI
jgi:molecular chaperone DnaJ